MCIIKILYKFDGVIGTKSNLAQLCFSLGIFRKTLILKKVIYGVYFNLVFNIFFWYQIYLSSYQIYFYNGIKNNSLVSKLLQFGIFSKWYFVIGIKLKKIENFMLKIQSNIISFLSITEYKKIIDSCKKIISIKNAEIPFLINFWSEK